MSELIKHFLHKGREYMCPHGQIVPLQPCFLCEIIKSVEYLKEAVAKMSVSHHERIEKLEKKAKLRE